MFKDKVITGPTAFPQEVLSKYENNVFRSFHSTDITDFGHEEYQFRPDISPDTRSLLELLKACSDRAISRGILITNALQFPSKLNRLDPDYQALRMKATRLATFHDWPADAKVSPEQLVEAGFFYTGTIDRVQCAYCRNLLKNWVTTADPKKEHRKHFPDCRFMDEIVAKDITKYLIYHRDSAFLVGYCISYTGVDKVF